jgi:hypothetical protein
MRMHMERLALVSLKEVMTLAGSRHSIWWRWRFTPAAWLAVGIPRILIPPYALRPTWHVIEY